MSAVDGLCTKVLHNKPERERTQEKKMQKGKQTWKEEESLLDEWVQQCQADEEDGQADTPDMHVNQSCHGNKNGQRHAPR